MFRMLYLLIVLKVPISSGRVLCMDENSSNWTTTGFSCPLKCENVAAAIKRLKMLDYQMVMNEEEMEEIEVIEMITDNEYHGDETLRLYRTHGARKQLRMSEEFNNSAEELSNIMIPIRFLLTNDRRHANRKTKFLESLTKILNNNITSEYHFTKQMSNELLKKTFGKNADVRHGVTSIPKIVSALKKSIEKHRARLRKEKTVIHLASRHCLSIHVPGCYCLSGYVENQGLCVTPKECFFSENSNGGAELDAYLNRIILDG